MEVGEGGCSDEERKFKNGDIADACEVCINEVF